MHATYLHGDSQRLHPAARSAHGGLLVALSQAVPTRGDFRSRCIGPRARSGAGLCRSLAGGERTVFEARSADGQRRPGDRGLANVLVSNGRDVVKTDADGRWWLPVAPGDSVFVVKPPNWSTSLNPHGLPSFSYLHQPLGSPVSPSSGRGVHRAAPCLDRLSLRTNRRAPGSRRAAQRHAARKRAELAYLRDESLPACSAATLPSASTTVISWPTTCRSTRVTWTCAHDWHPLASLPGNHDINSDATGDHHARETWKRFFGPRHYAFQHGEATFILLDNVHYLVAGDGRTAAIPDNWRTQLEFVRNVLTHVPRELIVVSMHIPLVSHQATNPADNTADRPHCSSCCPAGRTRELSGHMHTTEHHYLGAMRDSQGPRRITTTY